MWLNVKENNEYVAGSYTCNMVQLDMSFNNALFSVHLEHCNRRTKTWRDGKRRDWREQRKCKRMGDVTPIFMVVYGEM